MTIKDFIEQKIEANGLTKKLVYTSLGVTRAGFDGMLAKGNINVNDYLHIAKIIDFDPTEYFAHFYESGNISFLYKTDISKKSVESREEKKEGVSEIQYLRDKVDQLIIIISDLSKNIEPNKQITK